MRSQDNLVGGGITQAELCFLNASTASVADSINSLTTEVGKKITGIGIANNLTTTSSGYALDATQGKVLNDAVTNRITQIWSNSQPTYGQLAQTVTLSEAIENFHFYYVMHAIEPLEPSYPTGYTRVCSGLIPIGSPAVLQGFNFNSSNPTTSNGGLLMFRQCGPISGNQFEIGTGYYYGGINIIAEPYPGACVIEAIFGVR